MKKFILKKDLPGVPAGTEGSFELDNGIAKLYTFSATGKCYEFTDSDMKEKYTDWFEVKEERIPKQVILMTSGGTFVTDQFGEQMPELQKSWFVLYCEFLISKGFDPEKIEFKFAQYKLKPFKTENGWNWEEI